MTDDKLAKPSTPPKRPRLLRVKAGAGGGRMELVGRPEDTALAVLGDREADADAAAVLLGQLAQAAGESEAEGVNRNLALLSTLGPQDGVEALLGVHVVATHGLAVRLHGRAAQGPANTDLCRTAVQASRTVAQLLGQLDTRRRPAGTVQRIQVERIDAQQVALGCVAAQGGGGTRGEE
jgi:hypothetical protein